jgi:DNA-binding NarL/FixJ family response regulator
VSLAILAVGDESRLAALVEQHAAGHRRLHPGWPDAAGAGLAGVLCHGVIRDPSDAMRALLAVVAGADVVAVVPAWTPDADRLLDDLRRVADVEVVTAMDPGSGEVPGPLSDDDRAILDAYARGLRRVDVAQATSQSPRSLDRRVADLKRRLGARSIAHAIELARHVRDT